MFVQVCVTHLLLVFTVHYGLAKIHSSYDKDEHSHGDLTTAFELYWLHVIQWPEVDAVDVHLDIINELEKQLEAVRFYVFATDEQPLAAVQEH